MAVLEVEVKNTNKSLGRIATKMDQFIDSADKKFASKLTERIVYGLCAAILLGFVGTLTKIAGFW